MPRPCHCAYYRASKPFRISAWFRQPSSKRDLPSSLATEHVSDQARDRPSGLRAFAEVLLEPSGRDVWLGTAGTLEAAKITSLSDE